MIDFSHFHKLVSRRMAELKASIDQQDNTQHSVELDQTRVGRLSRMDAMQMQQMELELQRRQKIEYAALEQAVSRIENEEYGECVACGEEINPKRLEIDLTATLCIRCAERREH